MTDQQIHAHKVTKPIQLLAAWLVGLLLIDAMFLATALQLGSGSWERRALIIAAILNVPTFLAALFILQTKFRAELQEDTYYSEYLSKKTQEVFRLDPTNSLLSRLEVLEHHRGVSSTPTTEEAAQNPPSLRNTFEWGAWRVALNELHPQVDDIRTALKYSHIPLAEFFGNVDMGDSPDNWVISINESMPFPHRKHLLRTLSEFRFDGFHLWEPVREAEENEDVYVGSYGVDNYTRFSDQLRTLLGNEDLEAADLDRYCRANRRQKKS